MTALLCHNSRETVQFVDTVWINQEEMTRLWLDFHKGALMLILYWVRSTEKVKDVRIRSVISMYWIFQLVDVVKTPRITNYLSIWEYFLKVIHLVNCWTTYCMVDYLETFWINSYLNVGGTHSQWCKNLTFFLWQIINEISVNKLKQKTLLCLLLLYQ